MSTSPFDEDAIDEAAAGTEIQPITSIALSTAVMSSWQMEDVVVQANLFCSTVMLSIQAIVLRGRRQQSYTTQLSAQCQHAVLC